MKRDWSKTGFKSRTLKCSDLLKHRATVHVPSAVLVLVMRAAGRAVLSGEGAVAHGGNAQHLPVTGRGEISSCSYAGWAVTPWCLRGDWFGVSTTASVQRSQLWPAVGNPNWQGRRQWERGLLCDSTAYVRIMKEKLKRNTKLMTVQNLSPPPADVKSSSAPQEPESLRSHAGFYADTKLIITALPAGIIMSFPLLFAWIPFSYLPVPFSNLLNNCSVNLHATYKGCLARFPTMAGASCAPNIDLVHMAGT